MANVDAMGAVRFEALRFLLDVGDTQIEVDARLGGLGFGHALEDDGRELANRWEQHEVRLEEARLRIAKCLGPELGQPRRIGAVDHDVNVRLGHFPCLPLRSSAAPSR